MAENSTSLCFFNRILSCLLSRQSCPWCAGHLFCVCMHKWDLSILLVLLMMFLLALFLLYFFLLSFWFFFSFFFLLHISFLPLISTSFVFLYFPFFHWKEVMQFSNASDLRNLLLHDKKAGSHLKQPIVLKCIRYRERSLRLHVAQKELEYFCSELHLHHACTFIDISYLIAYLFLLLYFVAIHNFTKELRMWRHIQSL